MTTHLVFGDAHAHPDFNNDRATLLGRMILDIKPDVVVNIGDGADMPSLSSYDKGLSHFTGRNYRQDVESFLDFEDKLWSPIKTARRKLPHRVFCIGNHEDRIERAIAKSPELDGAISMSHLRLHKTYDKVVPYDGYGTPGIIEIDGIQYAHYVVAGVSGRPLSGLHHGNSLIQKRHVSTTVGHTHVFNYSSVPIKGGQQRLNGLALPCLTDYSVDWAGNVTDLWSRGVVIKRNVKDGGYDLEYVSLERMIKDYS